MVNRKKKCRDNANFLWNKLEAELESSRFFKFTAGLNLPNIYYQHQHGIFVPVKIKIFIASMDGAYMDLINYLLKRCRYTVNSKEIS